MGIEHCDTLYITMNQGHQNNIGHQTPEVPEGLLATRQLQQLGEVHLETLSLQELTILLDSLRARITADSAHPDYDWSDQSLSHQIEDIEKMIALKTEGGDKKYIQ